MIKYVASVQLEPKLHEGNLAYYWHIDQITEHGRFTVESGWSKSLVSTYNNMHKASIKLAK